MWRIVANFMCGYCIESTMIGIFVKAEVFSEELELNECLLPNHIQETQNISEIIIWGSQFDTVNSPFVHSGRRLLQPNDFHRTIDIAFCRFWETLLYQGEDCVYQTIVQEYGKKIVNKFLDELRNNEDCRAWISLSDMNLYEDSRCWDQFIGNKKQLIENAEVTLKFYYDWWIRGICKAEGNPVTTDGKITIIESIMNTSEEDWKRFYCVFPVVYFSFLILTKYKKNSDIIRHIALDWPDDVPDFPGHDLWLQRKAFIFCVREYGIQFILENDLPCRIELIYYSLLKGAVCMKDLGTLGNYILLSNSRIYCSNVIDTRCSSFLIAISVTD